MTPCPNDWYCDGMSRDPTGAESRAMSKPRRKWWIGGVLLLVVSLLIYQWVRSRPIRIPLEDGTTLTISAITTGTDHSRPLPFTWQRLKSQIALGRWGWTSAYVQTSRPSTVLWFDGQAMTGDHKLVLVDRHGWRWGLETGSGTATGSMRVFQQIETDGSARIEVLGQKGRLGYTVIPLATAVPILGTVPAMPLLSPNQPIFPPAPPPVFSGQQPPDPYPIRQTNGPLEATLLAVNVRVSETYGSHNSEGKLELDTLWNSMPFPPQLGTATITDRFGRSAPCSFGAKRQFRIALPPQETVWNLHLQVFRNPDVPLDPEDLVTMKPEFRGGAPFFEKSGALGGTAWRATVVPTGQISLSSRFQFGPLRFRENAPILIVEVDPKQSVRIRVEPVDRQGNVLPAVVTGYSPLPPNVVALRCPDFDVAQGHMLRVGIEAPRLVQFRFRPNVVPAEQSKSPRL